QDRADGVLHAPPLLSSFGLGEVAHHSDTEEAAVAARLAQRELDRQWRAIPVVAGHLAAVADHQRRAGRSWRGLGGLGCLGHESMDVLADDLARVVAEDALGGRVDRLDRAVLVEGHDPLGDTVDHGADACFALLCQQAWGIGAVPRMRALPSTDGHLTKTTYFHV